MKTTFRNIKLNGTKEQIEWFWGLTGTERQIVARGVKRHGLAKEYDRQKQLLKNRLNRISGHITSEEFEAVKFLEGKLAAF